MLATVKNVLDHGCAKGATVLPSSTLLHNVTVMTAWISVLIGAIVLAARASRKFAPASKNVSQNMRVTARVAPVNGQCPQCKGILEGSPAGGSPLTPLRDFRPNSRAVWD